MARVINSQSVRAHRADKRGYGAGKKILGRKRYIAVDMGGRTIMINLTTADIVETAAQMILGRFVRAGLGSKNSSPTTSMIGVR